MKLSHSLLLVSILLTSSLAHGQRKPRITGNFMSMHFGEVMLAIETQTPYRFFYEKNSADTLDVNFRADANTLETILDNVFTGTTYHYAIDPANRVFITHDRMILTSLPPGFFGEPVAKRQEVPFDISEYEKKGKELKLAENKVHIIGRNTGSSEGTATIAGNVRDMATGEPLIGASVFVTNPTIGITTDQFGYYALTLPKGRHELKIQSIGMKGTSRQILLYSGGRLDIEMEEDIKPLKEVVVEAESEAHVMGLQMGTEKLDIKTMKQIPLALGETDIMKVVLTLPGVQSVGEGTVGLNVRGGAANQNLILLNDAVVYNPSHLFGFFSTFNPDVLKNVELYKSGIQAEYGGRLSSVLDVHTREGNTKEFTGSPVV